MHVSEGGIYERQKFKTTKMTVLQPQFCNRSTTAFLCSLARFSYM
jgi:hypothetical protein